MAISDSIPSLSASRLTSRGSQLNLNRTLVPVAVFMGRASTGPTAKSDLGRIWTLSFTVQVRPGSKI